MSSTRLGHLRVQRHARWVELGAEPGQPAELWIVLHGYGQRAGRFARRFAPLAGPARRIVAPEGLSRFYLDESYQRVGASWTTREDREQEIEDTIEWLDALVAYLHARDGAPTRTVVLGFSQGAPTAGRWLARGRTRADRLICWGAGLPHDVAPEAHRELYAALHLVFVAGDADPIVPPERVDVEVERLREAGIAFELVRFGGGHEIDARVLEQLAARG
jgi:predicted esterase